MDDCWKEIEGWAFRYRISDCGLVQKLNGNAWVSLGVRIVGNRAVVNLRDMDGKKVAVPVARLMANAFMGGLKKGYAVIHKDGSKFHNELNNLRIVTQKEATAMSRRAARKPVVKVSMEGEIVEIYSSAVEAAKKNYYCEATIRNRCNGMVKNHFKTSDYTFQWEDRIGRRPKI